MATLVRIVRLGSLIDHSGSIEVQSASYLQKKRDTLLLKRGETPRFFLFLLYRNLSDLLDSLLFPSALALTFVR